VRCRRRIHALSANGSVGTLKSTPRRLGEGYFGNVAGVLGHTLEARAVVRELRARREKGYSAALPIAWTHLGLGETAAALEWLETALAEGDPFLGSAMVFPAYDAIREQTRFKRLARQLNLSA
jgi:hypothetical protein